MEAQRTQTHCFALFLKVLEVELDAATVHFISQNLDGQLIDFLQVDIEFQHLLAQLHELVGHFWGEGCLGDACQVPVDIHLQHFSVSFSQFRCLGDHLLSENVQVLEISEPSSFILEQMIDAHGEGGVVESAVEVDEHAQGAGCLHVSQVDLLLAELLINCWQVSLLSTLLDELWQLGEVTQEFLEKSLDLSTDDGIEVADGFPTEFEVVLGHPV